MGIDRRIDIVDVDSQRQTPFSAGYSISGKDCEMKEMLLTHGQVAIVDDKMFEWLNQWKWRALYNPCTNSYYACTCICGKTIRMHRLLTGTVTIEQVDHINHNTLDNRRSNLRVCTKFNNQANAQKRKDNTSGYKGVSLKGDRWRARIQVNKVMIYIGNYDAVRDAGAAYDDAAIKFFGEFALTNKMMGLLED